VNLRASFANSTDALFPNEFVNIHLLVDTLQNAVLVPSPAVQDGAPGSYVYVVQPNHTVKVQVVTTGPTDGTNTVIAKGISPGDVVVTDGVDRLSDGMKVTIASEAPSGSGSGPSSNAASGSDWENSSNPSNWSGSASGGQHKGKHKHKHWPFGQGAPQPGTQPPGAAQPGAAAPAPQ
jgi:multidrug efflux system membrane fusion protein